MDLGLKDKVALVAAASQGLGFAAARKLSMEGARVFICSRDKANINTAAEKIAAETGGEAIAHVADVSKAKDAARFVNAAVKQFGRIDILVTNAGGPPPGGFDDVGLGELDKAYRLTLESAVAMMNTAIPLMRAQKWGRIVNITSITVKQPEPSLLMSNTMRAALIGFTKSVARETAADNVLINNVAPGYTHTERLDELARDLASRKSEAEDKDVGTGDIYAEWENEIPARRLGKPEELANVIAFLSSEAASYVTGVTIQVDGGYVQGIL
jgi:3-oxoacyl-[acyl-carrier protein] reductase